MSAIVSVSDLVVDLPILDADFRSLRKTILTMGRSGGRLGQTGDGGITAAEMGASSSGGRLGRSGKGVSVRALDDLSFTLGAGDRLALLGHNGAGKTTLLRTLAGIYHPCRGSVRVSGSVATLFDLALGLSPDATGYDNIRLRALFQGMSDAELAARAPEIAEFSELGDFLRMPARTYSAGMLLRLGFAAATAAKSDVLLMDEWLSVGDADFMKRADARLNELVQDR